MDSNEPPLRDGHIGILLGTTDAECDLCRLQPDTMRIAALGVEQGYVVVCKEHFKHFEAASTGDYYWETPDGRWEKLDEWPT